MFGGFACLVVSVNQWKKKNHTDFDLICLLFVWVVLRDDKYHNSDEKWNQ
ncbi:hypothetical protein BVRB_6g148530 [Beta vulgaris subsp. vulgaris]|nr:hypothetical protein BVRB_6g148530 [Beta vulgaris subsp. vulgaris]